MNMPTITAGEARKSLFPLFGQVNEDHSAVTITSKASNGVLLSEDDYKAGQTTLYLLSTPANARRLFEAIEHSERGEFQAHELDRS